MPLLIALRLPTVDAARFAGRNNNEEVALISEPALPLPPGVAGPLRTLAVRMSDDLRAQLDVIAQLNDRTVTEEIRIALESWIERSKNDASVLARAETVRAEIERNAQVKRNAIAAIFAGGAEAKARPSKRDAASS